MECCKKKKDHRIEKLIMLIEELNEQQKQIVDCIAKLQQAVNIPDKK